MTGSAGQGGGGGGGMHCFQGLEGWNIYPPPSTHRRGEVLKTVMISG